MTTFTAPEDARVKSASLPDRPRLRVRCAGRPDQTVPVVDGKCTIGSSPRCHVRLPAAEAQPLQCLVSLEAGAAVATRWAAGVLLNGREFSRQSLRGGDRLTIGSWELEWESCADRGEATAPPKRPAAEPPQAVAPPEPAVALPAAPPRPAAKTMLVASRQTEPFYAPAAAPPSAAPQAPTALSCQMFQDRLVVSLWTASHAARRRAKALLAAVRSSRERAETLAAAVAELEACLSSTRADAAKQLNQQLASVQSAAAAEASSLASQRDALRAELEQVRQDRDRVAADLETLQQARPRTAPPDPRLQTLAEAADAAQRDVAALRAELAERDEVLKSVQQQADAAYAAQRDVAALRAELAGRDEALKSIQQQADAADAAHRDVAALRAELAERDEVLKSLQQRAGAADAAQHDAAAAREALAERDELLANALQQAADAEAAREGVAQQLEALQQQQTQWLAECQALEQERAATLTEVAAERDRLQEQVAELASRLESPALATPQAPTWTVAGDSPAIEPNETRSEPAPEPEAWHTRAGEASEPQQPADDTPACIVPSDSDGGVEPVAAAAAPACADVAAEPPAAEPEYTPTSFIDKYHHLLDADDEPMAPLARQRPVLDEEYLSPSKFETSSPEEDSDEALEAYMSNMMRRMRGAGQSAAPFDPASRPILESAPAVVDHQPAEATPAPEPIELDANGMQRVARKTPIAADLAALRELANASARGAIAQHRQRRNAESAVTKGALCAVAGAAAGYLMGTAPGANSPWFWAGCAALFAAGVWGAQLAGLVWQRWSDLRANAGAVSLTPGDPLTALVGTTPEA